jgi:hypothetical protein
VLNVLTMLVLQEDEAAELEVQRKQQRSHIAALEAENRKRPCPLH